MRLLTRPLGPLRGSLLAVWRPQKKWMETAGSISVRLLTSMAQQMDMDEIRSMASAEALPSTRSTWAFPEVNQIWKREHRISHWALI